MIYSLERLFWFGSGEGIGREQGWSQQDLLEAVAVIRGKGSSGLDSNIGRKMERGMRTRNT